MNPIASHEDATATVRSIEEPTDPLVRLGGLPPELVVVGDADYVDAVCLALETLATPVDRVRTVEQAVERGLERALGHVLVSPLPELSLGAAIDRLRVAGPIFVVVPERFPDAEARRLYDAGTQAVLEWPAEALLLPRLVKERLRAAPRGGARGHGDEALARAIRTRLALARPLLPPLDVDVSGGVVQLHGRIDSIWKKERVSQMIAHVPGVRAVLTEGIDVIPVQRTDDAIERDVARVLEIMLGDLAKTVSATVDDGAVLLVGNVARREDIDRMIGLLGNVRGVRAIRNLVTISPAATERDRGMNDRLVAALQTIFPDSALRITCFGPVAVVQGTAPRLSTRREIVTLLEHQDGIDRVVDKVEVVEP